MHFFKLSIDKKTSTDFLNNILVIFIITVSLIIIRYSTNNKSIGIFCVLFVISSIITSISVIFNKVSKSKIDYSREGRSEIIIKSMFLIFIFSLILSIFITVLNYFILALIFKNTPKESLAIITILCLSFCFYNSMVPLKNFFLKESSFVLSLYTAITFIIYLLLVTLLYPLYNLIGLAVSFLLCNIIILSLLLLYYKRKTNIKILVVFIEFIRSFDSYYNLFCNYLRGNSIPKIFYSMEEAEKYDYLKKRQIIILADKVIKRQGADLFSPELQKTQKAIKISKGSNLFSVPEIIYSDKTLGIIEYEKIKDCVPIHRINTNLDIWDNLICRLGEILSSIHWFDFDNSLDKAHYRNFIHGDFSVINLLYTEKSDNICIIDWSLSDLFNGHIKKTNYLLDIAWFNISLLSIFHDDFSRYFDLIDLFLSAYLKGSPLSKYPNDIISIHDEIYTIFKNYIKEKNQWSNKKLYNLDNGYQKLLNIHIVKFIV